MKVGAKVYLKKHKLRGEIVSINPANGLVSVATSSGVIIEQPDFITLWSAIGLIIRILINLLRK